MIRCHKSLALNCAAVAFAICPGRAIAQCERAKLVPSDGAPGDLFGFSLALHSNMAVVSAPLKDGGGSNSGAVYVFERYAAEWQQSARITLPDQKTGDGFGWVAGITGPDVLAGSMSRHAVYVLEPSGPGSWSITQQLSPAAGPYEEIFPESLGATEEFIAAGSPDDKVGYDYGAVHVFERDPDGTWQHVIRLMASEPHGHSHLGAAVAVSGNIIVAGAPDDSDLGNWSGSACVFERAVDGTWSQTAKLLPSDGSVFWFFGTAVAVHEGVILVGADGADVGAEPSAGAAYVFERDLAGKWVQTAKLTASDPGNSSHFGNAVALGPELALIGAHGDKVYGAASGSAYVFSRGADGAWRQAGKLTPSISGAYDWFGHAVALSGSTALISAYMQDIKGEDSGAAYIFAVGPDDDADGVMDACEAPGDLNCDGGVDAFDIDPFVLALTNPDGYTAKYPQCTLVNADCNGDGKVDAFDIDPFVELLTGQ